MFLFARVFHKFCYGPEVMQYPTVCAIDEYGEVCWECDEDLPHIVSEDESDSSSPVVHHTQIDFSGNDPLQLMALLSQGDLDD
jgi:hypothetical protein